MHQKWNSVRTALLSVVGLLVVAPLGSGQSQPAEELSRLRELGYLAGEEKADRAYLGVYVEGENDGGGVKLGDIVPGSPAEKAGLQSGDVIVALGDRTIGSEEELRDAIAAAGVGKKVKVTFLRDGEKRRTSARLDKAPEELEVAGEESAEEGAEIAEAPAFPLPVEVAPLEPMQEGAFLGVQLQAGDGEGATVTAVVDGSPAQKAGVEVGDVILKVDSDDVSSVESLVEMVQGHQAGDTVRLTVERGGERKRIKATLGARGGAMGMGGATAGGRALALPAAPVEPEPPAALELRATRRARAAQVTANELQARAEEQQARALEEATGARRQIDELRQELDALRRQCEQQQRTIEAIRRALNGEPAPESTSKAPLVPSHASLMTGLMPAAPGEPTGAISFTAPAAKGGEGDGPSAAIVDGQSATIVLEADGEVKTFELPRGAQGAHVFKVLTSDGGSTRVELVNPSENGLFFGTTDGGEQGKAKKVKAPKAKGQKLKLGATGAIQIEPPARRVDVEAPAHRVEVKGLRFSPKVHGGGEVELQIESENGKREGGEMRVVRLAPGTSGMGVAQARAGRPGAMARVARREPQPPRRAPRRNAAACSGSCSVHCPAMPPGLRLARSGPTQLRCSGPCTLVIDGTRCEFRCDGGECELSCSAEGEGEAFEFGEMAPGAFQLRDSDVDGDLDLFVEDSAEGGDGGDFEFVILDSSEDGEACCEEEGACCEDEEDECCDDEQGSSDDEEDEDGEDEEGEEDEINLL